MSQYNAYSIDDNKNPNVFPKALEKFDSKPVVDELGLTCSDRKALQNGWAIIKKKQRQAALTIYVDLFTEYDYIYEKFRFGDKLNIQFASQHQRVVLHTFQIIFEQLDNSRFVKTLIKDIAARHRDVNVTGDEWRMYTYGVKKYFLNTLNDSSSPTFEIGLEKLMDYICKSNDYEKHRKSKAAFNTLLKFDARTEDNPLDFSDTEKLALFRAFQIIEANMKSISMNIHVNTLSQNLGLWSYFRRNGNICITEFSLHHQHVVRFFIFFVEKLKRQSSHKIKLTELVRRHKNRGLTLNNWKLYTASVKKEFLKVLESNATMTVRNAFNKLMNIFDKAFENN